MNCSVEMTSNDTKDRWRKAVGPFAGSPRGSQWTTMNRVILSILYTEKKK